MANVSEFSIVTYLRKPGHWRAAIFPKARNRAGGETVVSVVTPDDFASEAESAVGSGTVDKTILIRHRPSGRT
jgi:hypothetical protein